MGGVLAYKNLKRSKKKYRTTVLSIAISVFIFITMNAFIVNAFDLAGNYYQEYDYNMKFYTNLEKLSENEIKKLLSLDNIEETFKIYSSKNNIKIRDFSKINEIKNIELAEDYYITKDENGEDIVHYTGEKLEMLYPIALDDDTFKKYCNKIGEDYKQVREHGILCDEYKYYENESLNVIRRYKYMKGDMITGTYEDKEISIKVASISNVKPYGLENSYYNGGYLVLNVDYHKEMDFELDEICVNSNKPDTLEENVEKLGINVRVRNIAEEAREQNSMVLVVKIFLYGFIGVITLIGVTNIFNTITSNMELRQKEFAMLKSIGMTKKEFNRMINLETLFYGTKSLIYGIILGLLGTFALYKGFEVKIEKGMYIPTEPIMFSIIFVFILVFIIMRYSISKINKQNTIETIRKDNV